MYDDRSDDKAVEPESVVHGKAHGRDLLFVRLEPAGGIVAFDATNPGSPTTAAVDHHRRSGLPRWPGVRPRRRLPHPTGRPLLLVAHEGSGTTVMYEVTKQRS